AMYLSTTIIYIYLYCYLLIDLHTLFFFFFTIVRVYFCFFFFNDTATTEIYTLSLHDALPICFNEDWTMPSSPFLIASAGHTMARSEEHTSELQSRGHLVCRLLLEKKKTKNQQQCDTRYELKQ